MDKANVTVECMVQDRGPASASRPRRAYASASRRRAGALALLVSLSGCSGHSHYVVAATGTVIGVEVARGADSQTPHAKLGYNRAELALVPTNRRSEDAANGANHAGANQSVDVLMELRYGGIFDLGASSGIYQRLAVGATAVQQPGAAFMFARDADSEITAEAAQAVGNSFALGSKRRVSNGGIVTFLESVWKGLKDQAEDAEAQRLVSDLDAYAGTIVPGTYEIYSSDTSSPPNLRNVVSTSVTTTDKDLVTLMSYLGVLEGNAEILGEAEKAATAQSGQVQVNGTDIAADDLAARKKSGAMELERVRASLESGRPAIEAFDYYLKLLQE